MAKMKRSFFSIYIKFFILLFIFRKCIGTCTKLHIFSSDYKIACNKLCVWLKQGENEHLPDCFICL